MRTSGMNTPTGGRCAIPEWTTDGYAGTTSPTRSIHSTTEFWRSVATSKSSGVTNSPRPPMPFQKSSSGIRRGGGLARLTSNSSIHRSVSSLQLLGLGPVPPYDRQPATVRMATSSSTECLEFVVVPTTTTYSGRTRRTSTIAGTCLDRSISSSGRGYAFNRPTGSCSSTSTSGTRMCVARWKRPSRP